MEEQNKYYTPDIEELHVGYECELSLQSSTGWYMFDFSGETPTEFIPFPDGPFRHWSKVPIIEKEDLFNNGREIQVFIDALKDNRVRTKYLDQSDVESCGWEKVEESSDRFGILEIRGRIDKKYPGIVWAEPMGVFWNVCCAPVQINNPVPKVSITKTEWGGFTGGKTTVDVYTGECKSINELKKIMQWLKIK